MARNTDLAVKIFTASALNKVGDDKKYNFQDLSEANQAIQALASDPNPNNRYEIAQIMTYSVNDILRERTQYIQMMADYQQVPIGTRSQFKVTENGIRAFIQAKGATTARSKVSTRYLTVETEEVAVRPYVNYIELASGRVDFTENISASAYALETLKVQRIESVLHNAISSYSSPNYSVGSGAGGAIVKATLDAQIVAFKRIAPVVLIGDIEVISKLIGVAGFGYTALEGIVSEQNAMGYIGKYNGCPVMALTNPPVAGSLTPTLKKNLIYIVPQGLVKPLKVVDEGDVTSLDITNIDDNSYEVSMRQNFGAGFIAGNVTFLGVYEDDSL